MNKAIKLSDVCQPFTRQASYSTDVALDYIEHTLDRWSERSSGMNLLDLDPDFQRVHVWTPVQQSRYVEYILRGGYAAREIYFNCSSWQTDYDTPIQLVDGKQRLQAVRLFIANEIAAFGHLYREYDPKYFRNQFGLKFYINTLQTRKEVLAWYLDLNEGGTPHSIEEIEKVRIMLAAE